MAGKCNKIFFWTEQLQNFFKREFPKKLCAAGEFFFQFCAAGENFQKSSVILYIMAPQARKLLYTISGGPPETVGYTISEGGGGCIINAAHLKQANRPKSAQNRSTDPSQPRTQVLFRIPRT